MGLSIEVKKLKAALVTAAKEDTRFYLNGVFVEVHAQHILLVSADGYRMSVIRDAANVPDEAYVGKSFIIPRKLVEDAVKNIKFDRCVVSFTPAETMDSDVTEQIKIESPGVKLSGAAVDAKFPEWRRVLPNGPTKNITDFQVNAAYVGDFAKISTILGDKSAAITVRQGVGNGAYLVTLGCEDYVGVLMGARNSETPVPTWI